MEVIEARYFVTLYRPINRLEVGDLFDGDGVGGTIWCILNCAPEHDQGAIALSFRMIRWSTVVGSRLSHIATGNNHGTDHIQKRKQVPEQS